jgi:hypothetical protein
MKLIISILLLALIVLPLRAEETEPVNIEYNEQNRFEPEGIEKFYIADPSVASGELNGGTLYLKGKSLRTTLLYVWIKKKVYVYNIRTVKNKAVKKKTIAGRQVKRKPDSVNGTYNISNVSNFGNRIYNQNKYFLQSFNLNVPLDPFRGFNFKAGLINRFNNNFSQLENFNIPNLQLSYYSPAFLLSLGDLSFFSPGDLNLFSSSIKGIKVAGINKNNNYNIFSGFEQTSLNLYDINPKQQTNLLDSYFVTGASGETHTPVKNLDVFGSAISRIDLQGIKTNYFNLVSGFKWWPTENFKLGASAGTNFYGIALTADSLYRYEWETTKDSLELNGNFKHYGNDYLRLNSGQRDIFSLRSNLHHSSGLNLSGSIAASLTDFELTGRTISLRAGKDFNYGSFYVQGITTESADSIRNSLNIVNSFRSYFPVTLKYNLLQNISRRDTAYINQLLGTIKLPDFYSVNLFYSTAASLYSNMNRNQLSLSNNISARFNLSRDFYTSLSLSYNDIIPLDNPADWEDNLVGSLNTRWEFAPFHTISASLNYNSGTGSLLANQVLNSTISYNYNFGSEYINNFGDIKGVVFEDLNNNGLFDKDEKIMPGVQVKVNNQEAVSTTEGYVLKDVDFGNIQVYVETETLPVGYKVTTTSPLLFNFSSKEKTADFGISKQRFVRGVLFGSKSRRTSLDNVELTLDDKQVTRTDISGAYSFTLEPGKHKITIDPTTIPNGYTLLEGLVKEFQVSSEDSEINFIFKPQISLKGLAYNSETRKIAANTVLKVKYIYQDTVKEERITTDERGNFILTDLEEGTIQISSPMLDKPIEVEITAAPGEINVKVPLKGSPKPLSETPEDDNLSSNPEEKDNVPITAPEPVENEVSQMPEK